MKQTFDRSTSKTARTPMQVRWASLVASACACTVAAMKVIPVTLVMCAAGSSDYSKVWTGGIEFSASGPKDVAGTGFSVAASSGVAAARC